MTGEDLPAIEAWLRLPHVARWWTPDTRAGQEIAKYRQRVDGTSARPTIMLMVIWDADPIGWCQWYRWADYPAEAAAMSARDGEMGIDYAIGDPAWVGRGTGTRLVAALVTEEPDGTSLRTSLHTWASEGSFIRGDPVLVLGATD